MMYKKPWNWLYEESAPVTLIQVSIPDDLRCLVCQELTSDAVVMSCCARPACHSCACDKIIESRDDKCPLCGVETNLGRLVPNQIIRERVNTYCNNTGYSNPSSLLSTIPFSQYWSVLDFWMSWDDWFKKLLDLDCWNIYHFRKHVLFK